MPEDEAPDLATSIFRARCDICASLCRTVEKAALAPLCLELNWRLAVTVTVHRNETALLVTAAVEAGITIDTDTLRRQAKHSLATWHELSSEKRRCEFATRENDCSMHEHRLDARINSLVIVIHPRHGVGQPVNSMADVIDCATLEAFAPHGRLPGRLLHALGLDDT
jgi:hypothetical protein